MTTEEKQQILDSIANGMAGLKADLDVMVRDKTAPIDALKAKMDEYEQKYVAMDESLKALQKPASIEPLGAVAPNGDPKCGSKTFDEYIGWVKAAGRGDVHPQLRVIEDIERKAAGTGLNVANNEFGGYLVPEEYRAQILKVALDTSDIISKAMIVPMATNALSMPAIDFYDRSSTSYGGILFYWIGEEDGITESRPKFELINLRLKKCAGMAYMTSEMVQYSPITVSAILQQLFGEALAYTLDDVFLNGSGAAQPVGVINSGCKYSVAIETGQALATDPIMFENIVKMNAKMWRKANAGWYMNPDVAEKLPFMTITIGSGGAPVYLPANGIAVGGFNTLMGRPITEMDQCQALGTVGDIVFGDWSQYLIGVPQGQGMNTRFDTSIHLKFEYDQMAFRFIIAIDGQPWWRTYVTPKRGTTYRTPFVTLAVRT